MWGAQEVSVGAEYAAVCQVQSLESEEKTEGQEKVQLKAPALELTLRMNTLMIKGDIL